MSQSVERTNPQHVAFIMDGNGRWAKQRGLHRLKGHEQGAQTVRTITEQTIREGIPFLTLYAFSTENWNRPKIEVEGLMRLLSKALDSELKSLMEKDIALNVIGDMSNLPNTLRKKLQNSIELTRPNARLTLTLALSYSSQDEIVRVCKKMIQNQVDPAQVNPQLIENYLDSAGLPEVDLMIRTGGEQRLSNFMLWQSAYAELFFEHEFWPAFTQERYVQILEEYKSRERRFGKISEQIKLKI